jgi:tetratricopeptide (TPR) repeat protein
MERFEMHELLRQYAEEKLEARPAERRAVYDRHAALYAGSLQTWGVQLRGPSQQETLVEMDVEIDNARKAWEWAAEHRMSQQLLKSVDGLCRFYEWRGRYGEGYSACHTVTERLRTAVCSEEQRVRARVLAWEGTFCQLLGRTAEGGELLQQSLSSLDDLKAKGRDVDTDRSFALLQLGKVLGFSDPQRAQRAIERGLSMLREQGDRYGVAEALASLGTRAWGRGEYQEAKALYGESLSSYRALGDPLSISTCLWWLGFISFYQGRIGEARRLAQESLEICRELGNREGVARGLNVVSISSFYMGEFERALSPMEEAIAIYKDVGQRCDVAMVQVQLAFFALHMDRYDHALDNAEKGLALAYETESRREVALSLFVLGSVELARDAYDSARQLYEESATAYEEISQREESGWAHAGLACVAYALEDLAQMKQHLYIALKMAVETQGILAGLFALPGIALWMVMRNEIALAIELYALASSYPFIARSSWFEEVAGRHIAAAAAGLPEETMKAAQERGRGLNLQHVLVEFMAKLDTALSTMDEI